MLLKELFENINQPLLAPNGKKSNLNKGQYYQVRTTEFKAWFGDWEHNPKKASKILDYNGEPLVVYHGTDSNLFSFNNDALGSKTKARSAMKGFFLPILRIMQKHIVILKMTRIRGRIKYHRKKKKKYNG